MFLWQIFFKIAPHSGAMNYFDSAIRNSILSGAYIIKLGGGLCINLGGSALISSTN